METIIREKKALLAADEEGRLYLTSMLPVTSEPISSYELPEPKLASDSPSTDGNARKERRAERNKT